MEIKRHEDSFGAPVEHKTSWTTPNMHRTSTPAERDNYALQYLDAEGRKWSQDRQNEGKNIQFDHVQFIRREADDSKTKTSPTGETDHRAWGIAVGYVFYQI